MNPLTLPLLATTLSFAGALVAVPSLAVLLLYAVKALHEHFVPSPHGTDFGSHPDALLLMLKVMVKAAELLGRLADFLFDLLAVASVFGVVLGAALWFTGRGLQAGAPWARASATVLLLLALLPSLLLALSLRDGGRAVTGLAAAACALGLHTLWAAAAAPSA